MTGPGQQQWHDLPVNALIVWVVYWSPSDFPGLWVLRPQWALPDGQVVVHPRPAITPRYELLPIPEGLVRIPRDPEDDPTIVEVWI